MLQKFAMVKYGVFVAKICKHALCASTVRDIWWSPLARQLLPPCTSPNCMKIHRKYKYKMQKQIHKTVNSNTSQIQNTNTQIANGLGAKITELLCIQGGRSWRASGDHQISLTALARSACLQIFATKTPYFTIANFCNINIVFYNSKFCLQNL